MLTFQELFLAYLDNDDDKYFHNLIKYFNENKISENKQDFITLLCCISKISKNHHCSLNLYEKFGKVLMHFQQIFSKYCTNIDIFNIFKKNKLILLILFNNKIIIPDVEIYNIISTDSYKKYNYVQYFQKEFKAWSTEQAEIPENFEEKRKIGENENLLYTLIRKDEINEFIKYHNQFNVDLSSKLEQSVYETNSFLLDKTPTLIEYALFFGSIQIIRYMICNKVSFTESSWSYCVHSKNYELIHLLEENNISPKDNSYNECLLECIKCHHNEIAEYILNNKITENNNNKLKTKISFEGIRSHNYYFIPDDHDFLTGSCEPLVLLTKGRYYKLYKLV